MKRIFALILILCFSLFSCSNDGKTDQKTEIPKGITVEINGVTKVFNEVSVEKYGQTQGGYVDLSLILSGRIEKNSIERIVFSITNKGENGDNKVNQVMYVDQNDNEYYYDPSTNQNFSVDVIENDLMFILKGRFSGILYQNKGGNKLSFKNGSFNVQY
ncbi:hypothetical protein [Flavobacterium undicola]|uniref:hypothetical protein n=1 Tax=Flavobacterium undicola TaxID=1932779 RepID=UPI0013784AE8|nr:hypothetical protein [Flavobacterium undicola]MBA0882597.1 hypothetical protein [Flavobacterium undicola]